MLQDYLQVWKNDFVFTGSSNLNLGAGSITLTDDILVTTSDGILTAGGIINTTFDLNKDGPGILKFNSQDIKLHSLSILDGTFKSPSAPGSLSLAGNFVNNGTFINNNGDVIFNGNTLQTIGGSQVTQFNNLTLNNAAGAVLGNHENIEGTLTLTSGNLALGAYNLTLGEAAVAGNPSVTNMIVADGTGECRRNFSSDGSYLFPVGDASGTTEYSPVTLNFTSGSYNSAWVGVRVTDSQHPDDASTTDYLSRYWSISQSGINSCTYDITASFPAADISGNINNMITGQWLGSSPWIHFGPVSTNEISASGVTAFGDFTGMAAVISPFTVDITANPGASVCRNVPVSLTASPSGSSTYTYLWSPTGETSQTINPSTAVAGSVLYKVAVTDAIGNTITDTVTLRVKAEPNVTATPGMQTICSGTAPSIALTSSIPGTTYTWSVVQSGVSGAADGNGNTISQVLSVTGAGEGTAAYTIVPTADGCTGTPLVVVITVKPINTIALTSAAGTNNQVKCINTPIANITYATTGATGALFSGLPAGITGNWAANVVTISGIPTSNGISNYTVTLTGGCGSVTETGTITVPTTNTVTLSSGPGTDNQSRCINTALTNITYNTTSATGATFTGLPAGVTGSWAANKITISGSPAISGNFNYNITLTGGCGVVSKTGNISVIPDNTITLSSALGTDNQLICLNTAITTITYNTTGATGAVIAGLPAGVNGVWAGNVVTISGTPASAGVYPYTIILTGGCGNISRNGNITVNANNTIALSSAAGTENQVKCAGSPIDNITYNTSGATGAFFSGLPAGVSGSWAANAVIISGIPTVPGNFNYTVSLSGGCGTAAASGTMKIDPLNTIMLSSAAGTDNQVKCINAPVSNILYTTTGATGATFTGLPTGVSGSMTGNLITISGTPTASGVFNYTVTLTGGCGVVKKTGIITVNPDNTIMLSSAAGTDNQQKCINTSVTNITYSTTGSTGATFSGLPAGVSGNWSGNTATISGIPATAGTFNYTVTSTGGCGSASKTGSLKILPENTISLSSAAGTDIQVTCINTAINNITYVTTGATSASVSGLPAGITGSWAGNVFTISGTPSVAGFFNYNITLSGGCGAITGSGSIKVTPNNTITLSSAFGSDNQVKCINTAITNISYTTTGATGATFSGLPAGVSGSWSGNVITISGIPTASGVYPYNITLTGGCGTITKTGTLNITPDNTLALSSAAGTNNQTRCINTAIANITYATTGASGATFAGLPAGVNGNWAGNVITISGSPTVSGTYNYTVTLTGGCSIVSTTGTISVTPNNTIILTSAAGTDHQTVCVNNPITDISYATTGASGASFSGLPAGVSGSWAGNVITIHGIPSTPGSYTYTISLSGGCGLVTKTGTITVSPDNSISLSSAAGTDNQAKCVNTSITNITYVTSGATGAVISGLPAGVSGNWSANTVTISGTPTVAGIYNYTVALSGGCSVITKSGTITVIPANTIALSSAAGTDNQLNCVNTAISTITYTTTGATGVITGGLPAGVSGSWSANQLTINGTPVTSGSFNYTITLTGGCGSVIKTGTIGVTPNNTITLSSAFGSDNQTKCINTPISNITYTTTGATGATVSGLPAGVSGNWSGNVFTISGSANVSGTFNYTITLTGGCGVVAKTGIINISPDNTILLSSASGTDNQTRCINTSITNITYTSTGATGATFSGLPAGVTGSKTGNLISINGTPVASGTFNYKVTLTGGCGSADESGIITVVPQNTITLSSAAGTDNQSKCVNIAITPVTYATTGATGASVTGLPTGVSGNWAGNVITLSGIPAVTGTFNYTITLSGGCGIVTKTGAITVVANNSILLSSAPGTDNLSTCLNAPITNITYTTTGATGAVFSGLPAGVTGNWAANVATLSGTPSVSGTFNYTVTLTGGCGAAAKSGIIKVNPIPVVTATPASQSICSLAATSILLSGSEPGTTFSWSVAPTDVSGASAGSGSSILQTLTATSTVQGKVIYTITPVANFCAGVPVDVEVTVKQNPVASVTPATQTICAGTATALALSSNNAGSTYSWTVIQSGVSGASASSGAAIAQVLSATASNPGTATYSVSASAGGCTGTPVNAVVTVKPLPVAVATPSPQTICSGTSTSVVLSSNVGGTSYSWTRVVSPVGSITGSANGSGSTISQLLTNTTLLPADVTYTVTPSAAGCAGAPVTVVETVNPSPSLSSPLANSVCSNVLFTYQPSSNVGSTSFTWSRAAVVGIQNTASGGTGDINEILVNTTGTAKTVTYNYTLTANGCSRTQAITVTVNPAPVLLSLVSPLPVCSDADFNYSPVSSVAGTGFTWSRSFVAGISNSPNTGTGNISEALENTSAGDVSVPYIYTMTAGGCSGVATVTATIKPRPMLSGSLTPAAVCSNSVFSYSPASAVPGTTFSWSRSPVAGISNGPAFGVDDPLETLVNTNTSPVTVTYNYTLVANGCSRVQNVTVSVKPEPQVNVPADKEFCSGINTPVIALIGTVTGSSYNWTNNNPGIGLAATGTGDIPSFNTTNTTSLPVVSTIHITPIADGCTGPTESFQLVVNPTAYADVPASQVVCNGIPTNAVLFTGTLASISWSNDHPEIGLAATGTGNIASFTAVNPGTSPIVATITATPHFSTSGLGCNGATISFTITVNPTPAVNAVSSEVLCAGTNHASIIFSTSASGGVPAFNWSSSQDIGFGTSGSGNIPAFIPVNAGLTPVSATISVNSTLNSCTGAVNTFSLTVNPTPTVTQPVNQTICNNAMTSAVHFTGNATSYTWTNSTTGIGLAASGTGDIPSFLALNSGNSPTGVAITITPLYTNGGKTCQGTQKVAAFIVNPSPSSTISGSVTVCQFTASPQLTFTGTSGLEPYTFTYQVNGGASQTISTVSGNWIKLGVPTTNAGTFQYKINNVTSGYGCSSAQSASATVVVEAAPTATISGTASVCQNSSSPLITFTGANGTAPYTFSYKLNGGALQTITTTAGNSITLAASTATSGTFIYDLVSVSSVTGCSQAQSGTVTITVNSAPGVIVNNPAPVCSPATVDITAPAVTLGSAAGLNYTYWTNAAASVSYNNPAAAVAGTYYIKGNDPVSGCYSIQPVVVTINTTPTLVINNPAPVCAPGTVDLTLPAITSGSSAGLTLTYWTDAAATIPYATPANADDNTYYIKGISASGCSVVKPVVASVYATIGLPVFAMGTTSNACKGSTPITYTATVTNAFTLTYSLDATSLLAGNSINAATGQLTFAPAYTGTIQVTATATGCGAPSTAIHTITVNPTPSVTLTASPSTAICEGASVTLTSTSSGGNVMNSYSGNSGTVNIAIPDNSKTTSASSSITLSGSGGATLAATDVVMVTLNITHTSDRDLDIFLVDPSGTKAMLLSSDNGNTNNHYTNTVIRTDAPNSITTGTAPFTGTYKPEGSISTAPIVTGAAGGGNYSNLVVPANAILGASVDGAWQLKVFDDASTETGTLNSWSLSILQPSAIGYTSVVNGPQTIGAITYSGANNAVATALVTPPAGTQTYTITTTDVNGCTAVSNAVSIVVKPAPIPVISADYCTYRPKVRLTTPTCASCTYQWNTGAATNTIDVDIAGKYIVTVNYANGCSASGSIQVADELVVNGDFSAGNTAFTTGYGYKPDVAGNAELNPEGYYGVGTNGQNYHSNFWGRDHTSGTGNFLIVNGWGSAYTVWEEANVPVAPNTDYYFAAWAISLNNVGPYAKLRFEVNGVQVGSTANLTAGTNSNANAWKAQDRFYGMWNSGSATTATIRIINLEPNLNGNDFGIDDISFGTLVDIPFTAIATSNSPAASPICSRGSLQLTSAVSGGKSPIVYSWTGPNGFTSNQANPVIANIPYTAGGTYTLSVTDWYNCPATVATTDVVLYTTPEIADRSYTICSNSTFTATPVNGTPTAATIVPAGTTFSWGMPSISPAGSVTGASAQANQAVISQTLTNTTNTVSTVTYNVTPVAGSCTGTPFKVTITVNPGVTASAGSDRQICAGSTVALNGTIGGAATSGNWTGGTGTFAPNRNTLNAVYTPSAAEATAGTVTLTLNTNDPDGAGPCSATSSSVLITINSLPVLTSSKVNVSCNGTSTGSIDLSVSGGTPAYTYNWSASGTGLIPVGQSNNQDLSALVAGTYTVAVSDTKSCGASTTITITEPTPLVASESHTTVPCSIGATSVVVTASGGTSPYVSGTGTFAQFAGTTIYTVTDSKGCTADIAATVVADPNTAPVISTCPVTRNINGCSTASITGPAFSDIEAVSSYLEFSNAINKGVASDNCAVTSVTYQDIASSSCPVVVTRTWILGDASGLTTTCNQVINVYDNVAPVWMTAAGSLNRTVECSDGAGLAAAMALFPVAADACDADVSNIVKTSLAYVVSPLCSQRGTYTNTWTVTDDCGNTSAVFTQVISVVDNTAPTWQTAAGSLDRTVECSDVAGLASAKALKPVAIDLCDGNVTNLVKVSGGFVAGSSCPNQGTITNTWTVSDDCGNVSTVFTQRITVVDNTPPVWLTPSVALNRTLNCSDAGGLALAQQLMPIAWDNCDASVTDIVKTTGPFVPASGCALEGSYTNTWTVADNCGNVSAVFTQLISIVDNTDPAIICPVSNAFSCDAPTLQPSETGVAFASGDCGGNPSVTWADAIVPGACAGNYQVNRTWTATNICGKTATCVQAIFVQDATPPVIQSAVTGTQDIYTAAQVGYIHPDNSWDATATDNCSGASLVANLTGATNSGPFASLNGVSFNEGLTTVTWTATDGCGISADYTFNVNVAFAPQISCPANISTSNQTNVCTATLNPGFPVLSNGTAPVSFSWVMSGATSGSGTGAVGNYTFNLGTTTITWTATNVAGTDICSQTITVADNQAPVFSKPSDQIYCVKNIITADFFEPTTDIVPDRPDYYVLASGSTDLNLNLATVADNCAQTCTYEIRWRIDFHDGTSLPAGPATFLTGQPSAYGADIVLPGSSNSSLEHHITYWVVDCHGNVSAPGTSKITISPRPEIIKLN